MLNIIYIFYKNKPIYIYIYLKDTFIYYCMVLLYCKLYCWKKIWPFLGTGKLVWCLFPHFVHMR